MTASVYDILMGTKWKKVMKKAVEALDRLHWNGPAQSRDFKITANRWWHLSGVTILSLSHNLI